MKASEIKLNRFLGQNDTQFIIPVYQRNYDWTTLQCKQLLDDVLGISLNDGINAHFLGSIVYVHDDVYAVSGIRELTVIDGQQRLTTITLIYLLLHQLAERLGNLGMVNRINETYLINKFADEEKLKLRPTANNDRALKFLLRGDAQEEYPEFSRLVDNFNYFKGRINENNFEAVLKGLDKLMFVEISLEREKDDPQRIFESLNSTGLELSQADLIRNYILMGLNRTSQNKIYENYWKVIETLAKEEGTNTSKVSDYIRDYLTLTNKKIPNKQNVYGEFKNKYPSSALTNIEDILSEVKTFARYYNKLINPRNEQDSDIRQQLEYINTLEINVAYPFLLKVYDDYTSRFIDKRCFIGVLELIQSFSWRRSVIGLGTNALNKIFMRLYEDVDKNNYLFSVQASLLAKKGTQRFPQDSEVVGTLKDKDVYGIKPKNRIYFLQRLENHNNKEQVDFANTSSLTIEHIFPQKPDPRWKLELEEEDYKLLKEKYLNTIANLTLSGNNGSLGNRPFRDKRDMNVEGKEQGYRYSRLWLNRYLSTVDRWTTKELEERFELIRERFLDIWKLPNINLDDAFETSEMSIFDAEEPKYKKLEYAIFFDQKLEISEISKLYVEVVKALFELHPQTFFTSDLAERVGLTKEPQALRQAAPINDTYYIEANHDSKNKFDRIKRALTVFDFEDELLIKYQD